MFHAPVQGNRIIVFSHVRILTDIESKEIKKKKGPSHKWKMTKYYVYLYQEI